MRKALTSLIIFILAFFVFFPAEVSAKVITKENGDVNVAKTEVVNDDLFIGAQTVGIDGVVNGDVFIGAQTVKITGIINGSLHVGANTVDISGKIKGNVYTGAQNVLVNGGEIGGSLLVGAATVSVDKLSLVGGSILAGAGSLALDSQVGRSVYAGTGSFRVGEDAAIGKDLYYATGQDSGQASISEKAKIAGNIYKSEVDTGEKDFKAVQKQAPVFLNSLKVGSRIVSYLGALIVGFLFLKFFQKNFSESSKLVSGSFGKSLGIGFLVSMAFIPGLIILLITVVGIPLAGLSILMFALYSYLAKIVVGSALGNWISQKFNFKTSVYGAFALGLLAIYILKMIPFVGFLSTLVVLWAGLGALTLQVLSKSK